MKKLLPNWFKILIYKISGKKPWSRGYFIFKFFYIKKAIYDKELMDKFKNSKILPKNYGFAIDERVVEYPWLLTRMSKEKGNLLDAGSALNFKEILEFPAINNKKITIVNLNPEENCFWQKRISYLYCDIRCLPFANETFDYIACISTLEHIGMDNSIYTKNKSKENDNFDFEAAILELKRVLKKGGRIFITVPFGKYQDIGRLQQFDSERLNQIIEQFAPAQKRIDFYKYSKNGWNISGKKDCQDCEYFNIYKEKKAPEDFAAASRAVACIEMAK